MSRGLPKPTPKKYPLVSMPFEIAEQWGKAVVDALKEGRPVEITIKVSESTSAVSIVFAEKGEKGKAK